jgi:hypothetical protein
MEFRIHVRRSVCEKKTVNGDAIEGLSCLPAEKFEIGDREVLQGMWAVAICLTRLLWRKPTKAGRQENAAASPSTGGIILAACREMVLQPSSVGTRLAGIPPLIQMQ